MHIEVFERTGHASPRGPGDSRGRRSIRCFVRIALGFGVLLFGIGVFWSSLRHCLSPSGRQVHGTFFEGAQFCGSDCTPSLCEGDPPTNGRLRTLDMYPRQLGLHPRLVEISAPDDCFSASVSILNVPQEQKNHIPLHLTFHCMPSKTEAKSS